MSLRRLYLYALIALVIGAHVAMLTSDRIPIDTALRLTAMNAALWLIILAPLIWLRLRGRKGRDSGDQT